MNALVFVVLISWETFLSGGKCYCQTGMAIARTISALSSCILCLKYNVLLLVASIFALAIAPVFFFNSTYRKIRCNVCSITTMYALWNSL